MIVVKYIEIIKRSTVDICNDVYDLQCIGDLPQPNNPWYQSFPFCPSPSPFPSPHPSPFPIWMALFENTDFSSEFGYQSSLDRVMSRIVDSNFLNSNE